MTVHCVVIIISLAFSLNLVVSEQLQEHQRAGIEGHKSCKARYKEELVINLTHSSSNDCYRAWKYGVSNTDELESFYGVLCQPGCSAVLSRLEESCGATEGDEYSVEQLRHTCARNEAGKLCYALALEESSTMSRVYAQCWEEEEGDKDSCSKDCKEAIKV